MTAPAQPSLPGSLNLSMDFQQQPRHDRGDGGKPEGFPVAVTSSSSQPVMDAQAPEVGRLVYVNTYPTSPPHHTSKNFDKPTVKWVKEAKWIRFFPRFIISILVSISHSIIMSKHRRRLRSKSPFVNNTVTTAQYTLWNFLPLQLFAQFSKFANLYFLFISILQAVPDWSPTGRVTTIIPLSIFVTLSMAREAWDDYARHRQDTTENRTGTRRLKILSAPSDSTSDTPTHPSSRRTSRLGTFHRRSHADVHKAGSVELAWDEVRWQDLHVGDIVRVHEQEFIPADLIVLSSPNPNGVCFIETANLDGETNLKQRQALPQSNGSITDEESLARFQ
ncbi:hypothetical protein HK102_010885, partial [Quaeritorhiza haematococci]